MDPQPTYPLTSEYMLDWIKNYTDNELYETMRTVEEHYFELNTEMLVKMTKSLKRRMKVIIQEYESVLKMINIKQESYMNPEIQRMLLLIKRGMQNRLQWL